MKTFLLAVLSLVLSIASKAQTSDNYLTVTYQGYISGQYIFSLTSKQSECNPDISINWSNDVTVTKISPDNTGSLNSVKMDDNTLQLKITGNYSAHAVFYFKVLTVCQWKGNQPQTLTVNTGGSSLPVKFTGAPVITAVYQNYVTVKFTVADQSQMKQYNVQFSRNAGQTWETVAVVIPDNAQTGLTYTVNVPLNAKN